MARLEWFHNLPGVWQDGPFFAVIWAQIGTQLKNGGDLNESERAALAELLKRMLGRPEARKALGIRPRSRTAERDDKIADYYMHLTMTLGKSATAAASEVRRKFPKVGARAIRGVLETRAILARARARSPAGLMRLIEKTTPTK
jgi:hypothetical protein